MSKPSRGPSRRPAATPDAELAEDVGHVDPSRLLADEQGFPDLTIGQATRQQPEHLLLAGREAHAEIVAATVSCRDRCAPGPRALRQLQARVRHGAGPRCRPPSARVGRPPRARHRRPGRSRQGGDDRLLPRRYTPGRRRPRSPPSMPRCRTVRRVGGDLRPHDGRRPGASAANARRPSQGPKRPRPGSERDGGRAPGRSPRGRVRSSRGAIGLVGLRGQPGAEQPPQRGIVRRIRRDAQRLVDGARNPIDVAPDATEDNGGAHHPDADDDGVPGTDRLGRGCEELSCSFDVAAHGADLGQQFEIPGCGAAPVRLGKLGLGQRHGLVPTTEINVAVDESVTRNGRKRRSEPIRAWRSSSSGSIACFRMPATQT